MIIVAGCRINSKKAAKFRKWAAELISQYVNCLSDYGPEFRIQQGRDYISNFDQVMADYLKKLKTYVRKHLKTRKECAMIETRKEHVFEVVLC